METEYSLIAIFGKEDFVLDFMKKKKTEIFESTKKSTENISAYKDVLARIEVKLFDKKEALQLQLQDAEVENFRKSCLNSNSK